MRAGPFALAGIPASRDVALIRADQTIPHSASWPAMAASVTSRLWGIGDIVKVLEDWEGA